MKNLFIFGLILFLFYLIYRYIKYRFIKFISGGGIENMVKQTIKDPKEEILFKNDNTTILKGEAGKKNNGSKNNI